MNTLRAQPSHILPMQKLIQAARSVAVYLRAAEIGRRIAKDRSLAVCYIKMVHQRVAQTAPGKKNAISEDNFLIYVFIL